jgi:hypothetical protein
MIKIFALESSWTIGRGPSGNASAQRVQLRMSSANKANDVVMQGDLERYERRQQKAPLQDYWRSAGHRASW